MGDKEMMRAIIIQGQYLMPRTSDQWSELSTTCLRLALLSHKQLDQREFSKSEHGWLRDIGSQLARCMLYEGNSYPTPLDDAPRIARIVSDPRNGSVLHAGIGRPRLMYVLYPWKDSELLCQGIAMPYHEVTDTKTLTDEEWRKRFHDKTRPPVPAWLKDFVPVEGVKLQGEKE